MGKKERKLVMGLEEDLAQLVRLVPAMESLREMLQEIAIGYHKHLKEGGASIPVLEKYLGKKESRPDLAADPVEAPVKEKKPKGKSKKMPKEEAAATA